VRQRSPGCGRSLLTASLAPSLDGCWRAEGPETASSVVLAKPREVLGDVGKDVVYTPVTPCRIVDTRYGAGGTLNAGDTATGWRPSTGTFARRGQCTNCGIPVKPAAVLVNLTVANTQSGRRIWWLSVQPGAPNAASLNWWRPIRRLPTRYPAVVHGGRCTSD